MSECTIKAETCGGKCTGYKGSHIWKKLEKDVNSVECDNCRDEGKDKLTFMHDTVNAQLGKKIFDKRNFKKQVKAIECICKNNPGLCK